MVWLLLESVIIVGETKKKSEVGRCLYLEEGR